jgi:hypothetical protein
VLLAVSFYATTAALLVWELGQVRANLTAIDFWSGPQGLAQRWSDVVTRLRLFPPDTLDPAHGSMAGVLGRYVHDCTAPTDRLLVTAYVPEMFFLSGRGFAGGQPFFLAGFFSTEQDQRLTITRLSQESVPIAIRYTRTDDDFQEGFPLVDAYLRERYSTARIIPIDGVDSFVVLIERGRQPTGAYGPTGLPCFR